MYDRGRIAVEVNPHRLLVTIFAIAVAVNTFGQDAVPPKAEPPKSDPAATAGDTVRKLSRRERKERIAKLEERHRTFLKDVEPIMLGQELDAFLILETNAQREVYIDDFWRRRDQAAGVTNRAFRDLYYARVEEAHDTFENLASDRSRMYLLHGQPMGMLKTTCDRLLQPMEIWTYPYIQDFGSRVTFLFFLPRNGREYRLWNPMSGSASLAELISVEAMGVVGPDEEAIKNVFTTSAVNGGYVSRIETECKDGHDILTAIFQMQANKLILPRIYNPPPINEEDLSRIVRSVVIANPKAAKLTADFAIAYPGKDGSRTESQFTLLVPRSQLTLKDVGGTQIYSLDVTGEVLRNEQIWEKYRYRFDYPADVKDEKIPIIFNRLLRPQDYQSRIKIADVHSGAEVVIENTIDVPQIFASDEQKAAEAASNATIAQLKTSFGTNSLRIAPMSEEALSGLQKIETLVSGDAIKAVEFWLDGKKIAVRRSPPFTLELDFGTVPQMRRIRAVGLDASGNPLTGDDIVVNTGTDPFRVRITSPRVAPNLKGRTRVAIEVKVPEGKELGSLDLYWNETKVATMYDPPFVHTVDIPEANGGVGYLRAVATLKDDATATIEDVVMINSPAFMAELNVHLVELPTTVLVGGKPVNDLAETAFKVLDEGQPVKLTKFEHVKNLPLSIGMTVDTSGSMQRKMEETQKAGATFLEKVMRKGDKAFLVAFDAQPQVMQKWTQKVSDVHAGLAKLRAEDYTALYDAVVYSLYNFLGVKGQKALVLLTDGKDTASKFTFDQSLEYARRAAVPIYAIGIGLKSSEVDVRAKLNRFASETGGNTYYIDDAAGLGKIYRDIENELRSQYVLGFYPPEAVKPGGKWREVSVQVSEGRAKTIRGYYP
jgi:Ca-activated chloride channel family protein